jgi:hypothetical protein
MHIKFKLKQSSYANTWHLMATAFSLPCGTFSKFSSTSLTVSYLGLSSMLTCTKLYSKHLPAVQPTLHLPSLHCPPSTLHELFFPLCRSFHLPAVHYHLTYCHPTLFVYTFPSSASPVPSSALSYRLQRKLIELPHLSWPYALKPFFSTSFNLYQFSFSLAHSTLPPTSVDIGYRFSSSFLLVSHCPQ